MYLRKTGLEEQASVAAGVTPCQLHLFQPAFKQTEGKCVYVF